MGMALLYFLLEVLVDILVTEYFRNIYFYMFSSAVARIMASLEHMQFPVFEDIIGYLEETYSDVCFRDSDGESVKVIRKLQAVGNC
jgi:hypothetical protein